VHSDAIEESVRTELREYYRVVSDDVMRRGVWAGSSGFPTQQNACSPPFCFALLLSVNPIRWVHTFNLLAPEFGI
jgi:hypothetical protein